MTLDLTTALASVSVQQSNSNALVIGGQNLFWCLYFAINSDLLFNRNLLSAVKIKSFSIRQSVRLEGPQVQALEQRVHPS